MLESEPEEMQSESWKPEKFVLVYEIITLSFYLKKL